MYCLQMFIVPPDSVGSQGGGVGGVALLPLVAEELGHGAEVHGRVAQELVTAGLVPAHVPHVTSPDLTRPDLSHMLTSTTCPATSSTSHSAHWVQAASTLLLATLVSSTSAPRLTRPYTSGLSWPNILRRPPPGWWTSRVLFLNKYIPYFSSEARTPS